MTSATKGRLHTLAVGTAGPRIAFLHGLFGQGRNWSQIARLLVGPTEDQARCLLLDLPDHGRSPWTDHFSLQAYAATVAAHLRAVGAGERWAIVGHSLGGKVAMLVALSQPDLVERLAVMDIAPRTYDSHDWVLDYIDALRDLPLADLADRAAADQALSVAVPQPSVRAFLLQNLRRHGHTWHWQVNLDVLAGGGPGGTTVGDWPAADATAYRPFRRPVLWVGGAESPYIAEADVPAMRALFPRVRQVTVNDAGHWLHAEQPQIVAEILRRFAVAQGRRH
ncbi:MAG: alpha/beta fold hydrolase [Candidatus Phosphoribacter sp.]|nr:alpha/beta fold hydrolase [Actinomycetales bacterium]